MSDKTVEIKNLNKQYKVYARKKHRLLGTIFPWYDKHGVFNALTNLDLDIYKGEVLGILGKNGAGKSTLLKMITGVVIPTSGELKVNGRISSLLELGTAFNTELTGIENIYQHGQVMGMTDKEIEDTKQEVIDFADIGDHLYQPVKTYSSGMFARLAFACAINVDPDILIVDEVLSVGDMAFQLKCFKKFEQFKKKGKTIIFVTHSIGDILANCNRTIILDAGRKIFDGDVKTGVDTYKKIIVGIDINNEKEEQRRIDEIKKDALKDRNHIHDKDTWKSNFNENPKIEDYGNGYAEVIDYGVFNVNGDYAQIINNDEEIVLKSKVKFKKNVKDPIFTMTIKNFNGIDMCGTNSLIEKIITGEFKAGNIATAEFKQILPLTPGKYTLSFSCTRFKETGELEVLNRKYDALLIEVFGNKDCVGLININSNIKVERV